MPTRTAPTVDGSPDFIGLTIHVVDASGDLYTDYIRLASDASNTDIESAVVAYQAATSASVWKVTVESPYEGDLDPDNADAVFRAGVQNGINMLMRNDADVSLSPRLVSPVPATMQGNQDIPLLVDASGTPTPLGDLVTAYLAVINGTAGTYGLENVQFTSRRERKNNPRIRT